MRRLLMPLVAAILLVPGVAAAQSAPVDEARATELGKQYITWIFDFQVDSLYEAMTPEFRDQIGGRDAIEGAITQTLTQQGLESEVVKEWTAAEEAGSFSYHRVSRFEASNDQLMEWTFVITPEGRMSSGGMRPYSGE